jgi:outer membrane protein
VARSEALPSVDGVVGWDTAGFGPSYGDALRNGSSGLRLGVRSTHGLNGGAALARKRATQIALDANRRNLGVLEEDLRRDVREAYRRLDTLKREHEIAESSLSVAELQANVAQLRFEKGLSDNFHVVDAEALLGSARLLELSSRLRTLLARVECLYVAGVLDEERFLEMP